MTYRPVGYLYVPLSTIAIQDRPLRGVQRWAPHLTSCRLSNVVKYGQNQRTLLQVQYTIHKYLQSNYTSILECQNARWNAIEYIHKHVMHVFVVIKGIRMTWMTQANDVAPNDPSLDSCHVKCGPHPFLSDIFNYHQRTSKSFLLTESSSLRIKTQSLEFTCFRADVLLQI